MKIAVIGKNPADPSAPYDGYDESDDTKENAVAFPLKKAFEYKG